MKSLLVVAALLFVLGCGPRSYSKKEVRNQLIPGELKNKTWTLRKIATKKIPTDALSEFNNSNGTDNCQFTFEFADKGILIMTFKTFKFDGVYLVDRDRFKYIHSGQNDLFEWSTTPECKIDPMSLAFLINHESFEFKIQRHELTLTGTTGDKLVFTSN